MHAELLLNQKQMHHFVPLDNRDHADPLLGYKRVHGSLLSIRAVKNMCKKESMKHQQLQVHEEHILHYSELVKGAGQLHS